MTSDIPIPMTLRPGWLGSIGLFAFCLVSVIIGILMVRDGKLMGYFCGGVSALGLPIAALQFHPKVSYLHLDSEGFTFCSLFRAHTVRWAQVREFGVISVWKNKMVAWNFMPDYPATGHARAISRSLSGYEAALPDTYGMKAQALASLMDSLRQEYGGQGTDVRYQNRTAKSKALSRRQGYRIRGCRRRQVGCRGGFETRPYTACEHPESGGSILLSR